MTINLRIRCELNENEQMGLRLLLETALQNLTAFPVPYLHTVFIVPATEVAATVNKIYLEVEGRREDYIQNPIHPAQGVAVSCETSNGLQSFIVLSGALFTGLTPEQSWPAGVFSTVLEELLHVWFSGMAWDRRGTLYLNNPDEPCERDLLVYMLQAFDEYLVNRHKAILLSTMTMVDGEDEGGSLYGHVEFGDYLTLSMQQCESSLRQSVFAVASHRKSVADVWLPFCGHLYRGFLEPLARSSVPNDVYGGALSHTFKPDTPFFNRVVAPYWRSIHKQMKRAFDHPDQTDAAIFAAVTELRRFLEKIGVTYRNSDDGYGRIYFDGMFFLMNP